MPGPMPPLAQAQRMTPLNAQQDQQRNRIAQALMAVQRPPPQSNMPMQRPQPGMMSAAGPRGAMTPPGSPIGQSAPMTGIGQALGASGGAPGQGIAGAMGGGPPGAAPMMGAGAGGMPQGGMPPGMMPPGAPQSMAPIPGQPGPPPVPGLQNPMLQQQQEGGMPY